MNGADICASPELPTSIWNELCSDLNLPTETISIDIEAEDADSLKLKALLLWDKCDNCEASIGEVLYFLCKKLHAPGKKDVGFNRWLKDHGKPRATAYRWIRKYANKNGLEPPFQPKAKNTPTLSQMGQGALSPSSEMQTRYPVPSDIDSAKILLHEFFEVAAPQVRSEWASELIDWIKNEFLTPDGSSLEELS
jgi:hypothetical protein